MQISNGELGSISTSGGLFIGSSSSGSIYVNGLTNSNTGSIGTITLIATNQLSNNRVEFITENSVFNKGVVISSKGTIFYRGMTTMAGATLLSVDTGVLTVQNPSVLSTTGQLLTIVADDIDITGYIDSGGN